MYFLLNLHLNSVRIDTHLQSTEYEKIEGHYQGVMYHHLLPWSAGWCLQNCFQIKPKTKPEIY